MQGGCGIPATLPGPQRPGSRAADGGAWPLHIVLYRDLLGENTVRVERVLHSACNLPRLL